MRLSSISRALAAFSLLLSAACSGGGGTEPPPPPPPPPVASVTVQGPATTVAVAGTLQLSAVTRDASGNVLTGRGVQWSTSADAVASVSSTGLVTAKSGGPVTITATSEGRSGSIQLTVTAPVSRVVLTPETFAMNVGVTASPFTVTAFDANGNALTGRPVEWSSTAPAVATVNAGAVTAVAAGEARIIASSEGKADTAVVMVTRPAALRFKAVAAGDMHSCGLTTDGTAYCWGLNQSGQLGVETTEQCPGATQTCSAQPIAVNTQLRFTAIDAGTNFASGHTCAIDTTGKAWCWGNNDYGQLGDGTETRSTTPRPVAGNLTFTAISAGERFTCAVATGGDAYCWGTNVKGEIGIGSPFGDDRTTPQKVAGGAKYTQVSAGQGHACALTDGGAVHCWGRVPGTIEEQRTPVPRGTGIWVAAGLGPSANEHACYVTTAGTSSCFGQNSAGQLGTPIGGLRSIHAGILYTCALKTDGEAWCWGYNEAGQLGSAAGGAVAGGLRFASLDTGWHTCAVTAEGVAYCWGSNQYGQLGGTTAETCPRPGNIPISCSRQPLRVAGQD